MSKNSPAIILWNIFEKANDSRNLKFSTIPI